MFPQLIAGPIVRYQHISAQLKSRVLQSKQISFGVVLFIIGLSYKVLLANNLGVMVDKIYALPLGQLTTPLAWAASLGYTYQIYFDFCGYSTMAVGLGLMLGFRIPYNFNFPLIAGSVTEFWQRWHITLTVWFKDYLYIPLGGNRKGRIRTYINLLTVFIICGIWHGAAWNFLLWGLYNGFFLVMKLSNENEVRPC
jgi:alginate O-acetyltransferase complex protein AlgI